MTARKGVSALNDIVDPVQRANCEAQVVDVYRKAIAARGLKAMESTRWTAAVHEAGHAVVYALTADSQQWAMPHRLKIWREPNEWGVQFWAGYTAVPPRSPPIHFDARTAPAGDLIVHAVRAIAGVVAESLFAPDHFSEVSSMDERMIAGAIAKAMAVRGFFPSPEDGLGILGATAARMLTANQAVHKRIAAALERQCKLDSSELRAMLRGLIVTPPEPSP